MLLDNKLRPQNPDSYLPMSSNSSDLLTLGLPRGLFPWSIMSTTALTSLFSSIIFRYTCQRNLISLSLYCMRYSITPIAPLKFC